MIFNNIVINDNLSSGSDAYGINASGDFIERGLRYIDEHYHRSDLSLEEVANFVKGARVILATYYQREENGLFASTLRKYVSNKLNIYYQLPR